MNEATTRVDHLDSIASYWNAESERYCDAHPEHLIRSLHPSWGLWHVREDTVRLVTNYFKPNCLLVDLGCGRGQDAVGYAARGATVIAIDISKEQLSRAICHPRVHYVQSSAERTPLQSDSVDVVISDHGAFDHSPPKMLLCEVKRILKPGGILALCTYSPLAFVCFDKQTQRIGTKLLEDYPTSAIKFDGRLVTNEMSYSAWVHAFSDAGLQIERLEELIAPREGGEYFSEMFDVGWATKWPSDIAWVVRKLA